MALSAGTVKKWKQKGLERTFLLAASQTVYEGAIIMITTATGHAAVGADTSGNVLAGVATEAVTSTTAGVKSVKVLMQGECNFAASAADQTWVGTKVYISDDATVALVGTTSNDVLVGRCTELVSASEVRVLIDATV